MVLAVLTPAFAETKMRSSSHRAVLGMQRALTLQKASALPLKELSGLPSQTTVAESLLGLQHSASLKRKSKLSTSTDDIALPGYLSRGASEDINSMVSLVLGFIGSCIIAEFAGVRESASLTQQHMVAIGIQLIAM